ncbi:hypothetical protein [Psychrobacter pygoscelis]|uniref:hypothetical protein n=1 Tax=Psychrobacter pygoscelis TaxID=2488563 RepID=UPI0010403A27|nr:hypothetical protein [Psychrobacter pygoscelis]
MIDFTQYGYSPANFEALVKSSGVKSNAQFIRDNNMSEKMFYRYKNGEVSITWQDWQALVKKYGGSIDVKA